MLALNDKESATKRVIFVAVMSALGNALSMLSITIAPIVPSIPVGALNVSIAFDLSHLTTFIVALFGGPTLGGMTGMVGGIVAAYEFGFSKGNFITGFGLPIGKALTGITAGFIIKRFDISKQCLWMLIPLVIISYIPEAIYTASLFILVYPLVLGFTVSLAIIVTILIKAFIEMVIMGLILVTLLRNQSFTKYLKSHLKLKYKL